MVVIQRINVFDTKSSMAKGVKCIYLVTHSVSEHVPPSVYAFLNMDDVNDYVRMVQDSQKQVDDDIKVAMNKPLDR